MANITFIQSNGTQQTIEIESGKSVMEGARENNIDGILAECGGDCCCSTCHCYIAPDWFSRLPPAVDDEAGLLEFAWEPKTNSRLTCQLKVTDDMEGLVLHVPEQQL